LVRWMFGILLQNYSVALVKGFCYLVREKDVVCDQCLFIRCCSLYIWGELRKSLSQDNRTVSGALRYCPMAAFITMAAMNGVFYSIAFDEYLRRLCSDFHQHTSVSSNPRTKSFTTPAKVKSTTFIKSLLWSAKNGILTPC